MREDRFFVNSKIVPGFLKISDGEIFHQIKNVLRKKIGEKIIVFNGKREEGKGMIKKFGKNELELEILEIKENEKEPEISVFLFCSLLKNKNFELLVQKTTEVGVFCIQPIICQRTIKFNFKKERLEKIIKEAAEQSGRGVIPILNFPIKFKEAVKNAHHNQVNLFFEKEGKKFSFLKNGFKKVGIFIGPEGGWSREELIMAQKENFEIFSLGKLTLRSETAAILASYLVLQ